MRSSQTKLAALLCPLFASLALLLPGVHSAQADYRGCRYQRPQDFLIRKNFMVGKAETTRQRLLRTNRQDLAGRYKSDPLGLMNAIQPRLRSYCKNNQIDMDTITTAQMTTALRGIWTPASIAAASSTA